ncbi:MAG: 2-succinylbenzoate--CoA ligase [Cyanobacteria bacterium J06623_7]
MNNELLNCLKSATKRHWLQYVDEGLEDTSQAIYELTTAQIDILAREIAQHPGKITIAIAKSNPVEFIAAFLAGVVMEVNVFLTNPDWQESEWRQVLDLVVPDLFLGDKETRSPGDKWSQSRECKEFAGRSHIMIPTGGTSGKIKFAVHTWSTLSASVSGFAQFFQCETINSVCTLPLYHVSGLMQLMRSLLTRGNLILGSYKSIAARLTTANKSNYFISLVPTQLQHLIDVNPQWLTDFKTVLVGGAPPPVSLLNRAREYRIPLALTYGMTETASGIMALKPADFLAGNNSNGRVLPHAQVTIEHHSSNNLESVSESNRNLGLITINSTSLCWGYYPELLSPTRSLVTDDLAYQDVRGDWHLVGRASHKIITGGENVFPGEVENAIAATNLVKDVCVIGMPDARWGEAVTAIYVPKSVKTSDLASDTNILDLVKQQLRSQLANYKQPKHWIKLEEIPRNSRGKINYRELQEIALKAISSQAQDEPNQIKQ